MGSQDPEEVGEDHGGRARVHEPRSSWETAIKRSQAVIQDQEVKFGSSETAPCTPCLQDKQTQRVSLEPEDYCCQPLMGEEERQG